MIGRRIASDGCVPLVAMYKALQKGWKPPDTVSETEYDRYKLLANPCDPMTAFVGFGLSFSGKYFAGYARSGDRNYALNAKNSFLKQLPKIQDVSFIYGEYDTHYPENCLVYCDPPYEGTTAFGYFDSFDHNKFWCIMREWSTCNTVIVSEYKAPEDFTCVAEFMTKTDLRVNGSKEPRIERLFQIC